MQREIEKPRPESVGINDNEIRITSQGLIRNYVNYATSLLQERSLRVIVLKAMGQAISKAVAATEIIKIKWNPHLHQDISISSVRITNVWEPIEEGLVPLKTKRLVSVISVTLSTGEPKKKTTGYQAPAQIEQPKRQQKFQQLQQPQQQQQHRQTLGQLNQDSYGLGRGRGSGRGRGWTRGGYGGYGGYNNNQGGYYGYRSNRGGYSSGGYSSISYNQGGHGDYRNNQENGGWNGNWSRGGGPGTAGPVYVGGYGGGPVGGGRNGSGGRGYDRARGRMGVRGRGGN
ncbi:protein FAM98A-like isoform X2 [Zingiber officinale]|uniref:protein FAM98A-like isoform X2 n=1 Tax=Zingiber officinale TaxID=94328 RepID=UPI001C4BB288|nr:protein FAM98A-like isoform X2 [Zingiber officinale]